MKTNKYIIKWLTTCLCVFMMLGLYPNHEKNVHAASNEEVAWGYFTSRGYTAAATAGIIGNFYVESGMEPTRKQYGGGPGRGLAQWGYGADGGRFNQLISWARSVGKSEWALETQLEWTVREMTAYGMNPTMKSTANVASATEYFGRVFERPACLSCSLAERTKQANAVFTRRNTPPQVVKNYASMDSFTYEKGFINAQGWAFNTDLQPTLPEHRVAVSYVAFLMDADTGLELSRTKEGFYYRKDVANVFSHFKNVGYGGFQVKFPMNPDWKRKNVFIMIRFANDTAGNISKVEDNYLLRKQKLSLPPEFVYKKEDKVVLQNNATHDINGQPILRHLIGTMGTVNAVMTKVNLLNGVSYSAYRVDYEDGASFVFVENNLRPTEGYLEFVYGLGTKVALKGSASHDIGGKLIPKHLIGVEGTIVDRGANQSAVDKKAYSSYRVNYKDGTSLVLVERDLKIVQKEVYYQYPVGGKVVLNDTARYDVNGQLISRNLIGTQGVITSRAVKKSLADQKTYASYQVKYADETTFTFVEHDLRMTTGYLEFSYFIGNKITLKAGASYDIGGKSIPKHLIGVEGTIVDRGVNQSAVDKKAYASYRVNYKDGTSLVLVEQDLKFAKK